MLKIKDSLLIKIACTACTVIEEMHPRTTSDEPSETENMFYEYLSDILAESSPIEKEMKVFSLVRNIVEHYQESEFEGKYSEAILDKWKILARCILDITGKLQETCDAWATRVGIPQIIDSELASNFVLEFATLDRLPSFHVPSDYAEQSRLEWGNFTRRVMSSAVMLQVICKMSHFMEVGSFGWASQMVMVSIALRNFCEAFDIIDSYYSTNAVVNVLKDAVDISTNVREALPLTPDAKTKPRNTLKRRKSKRSKMATVEHDDDGSMILRLPTRPKTSIRFSIETNES